MIRLEDLHLSYPSATGPVPARQGVDLTPQLLELFATSLWETAVMVGLSGLVGAALVRRISHR